MTREQFQAKYGDRLVGLLLRGFAQQQNYAGDPAQQARAVMNMIRAAQELTEAMYADLRPSPTPPQANGKPAGPPAQPQPARK